MIISLIAAYALDDCARKIIGKDNKIPWHSKNDLRRFREYTSKHPIVMGRKTFQSIGRVLPDRQNIILSSDPNFSYPGTYVFSDVNKALEFAGSDSTEVFVIGGETVYKQTIQRADRLYLTRILKSLSDGDTFFPYFNSRDFVEIHKEILEEEIFSIFQRKRIGASNPLSEVEENFDLPDEMMYCSNDFSYTENM